MSTLTEEQIAKQPEYVEKWLKIGLRTDVVPIEIAYERARWFAKNIMGKSNLIPVQMDSPLSCWLAACMLSEAENQVESQVGSKVWVENQVWNKIWDKVRDQVGNQVENQVENQICDKVVDKVEEKVGSQVGEKVMEKVAN